MPLRASASGFGWRSIRCKETHIHLIAEADGRTALTRGVQGLAVRVALAINKMLVRKGRVLGDRYHAHQLKTPLEVRSLFST